MRVSWLLPLTDLYRMAHGNGYTQNPQYGFMLKHDSMRVGGANYPNWNLSDKSCSVETYGQICRTFRALTSGALDCWFA